MGLRNWAKKLEREARGELSSFELLDGSRYYFVPGGELYLFCFACLEAGNPPAWPSPPEVLLKVMEARDPAAALKELWSKAMDDIFPYDPETLVYERRLEPRSIVVGRDPYDQVVPDLSE